MMRFILFFVSLWTIHACSSSTDEKKEESSAKVSYLSNQVKKDKIPDAGGKSNTARNIPHCNSDSLLQFFNYIKSDFPQKSYYNKHWWNHYWLQAHLLMAGVDSAGNYFLTMTTYFPPEVNTEKLKNTEVWVYNDTDTVKTNSSLTNNENIRNYDQNWMWIGNWNALHKAYDQPSCSEVMKFIYENRDKNLHYHLVQENKRVDAVYTINKKNRNAIAQCYELGKCLKEKQRLSQ